VRRQGNRVNADGEAWFTAGSVEFPVDDPVEVGLYAIGMIHRTIYHGAFPEGMAVRFEAFEVWGNQNPKEVKGMECFHCKGELVRGTVPYTIHRRGYHFVLDAAPAWVCEQCGEPMFDATDVKAIQSLVAVLDDRVSALEKAA